MATTRERLIQLNRDANYRATIAKLPSVALQDMVKLAEETYYNATEEALISDHIYDHLKQRYDETCGRAGGGGSGSGSGGRALAHAPVPDCGELVPLPYWLGSLSKIVPGNGKVGSWSSKFKGPYLISAKLDGISGLWTPDGKLFTRGNGRIGQDISGIIPYIQGIPASAGALGRVLKGVRGELIFNETTFRERYQRTGEADKQPYHYKNSRNAIAGIIRHAACHRSYTSTFQSVLRDIEFVAYEAIVDTETPMKASQQIELLSKHGFRVVKHCLEDTPLTDDLLTMHYQLELEESNYAIDGMVVYSDAQAYPRNTSGNPSYAVAFKMELDGLIEGTVVQSVSWNTSRYGFLKPVLQIDPVEIDGTTIRNVTAHNAKFVVDNCIGPGAEIKVIRSQGVIPKILEVLAPASSGEPSLPLAGTYRWNGTGVEIISISEHESPEITIAKLHYFLVTIGAKGIGPKMVERLYQLGYQTVDQYFSVTREELLARIGGKTAENVAASLAKAIGDLTLPVLMAASGFFERGLGVKKFELLLKTVPNLMELDLSDDESLVERFNRVPGFASKTAESVAAGLPAFHEFFHGLLQSDDILKRTTEGVRKVSEVSVVKGLMIGSASKAHELTGKNVYMTGFRDPEIKKFLESVGAKIQSTFTAATHILLIKDSSYHNNKTQTAEARGTKVLTRDEFVELYV